MTWMNKNSAKTLVVKSNGNYYFGLRKLLFWVEIVYFGDMDGIMRLSFGF
jgi:hypothetical protein